VKDFLKKVWAFTLKYPVAVIGTVLLVALSIFLAVFGHKMQIGGLLGLLWGKKDDPDPNIRVLPPPDRVDKDGKPIPAGESDDKGWTQAPINVPIQEPGIFSNPDVVVVKHPDKGEVKIPLPEGVKNKDVKQVVEVAPNVYQVRNNDKGVNAGKLLEDLEK
jgi:hypothetical protein